MVIRKMNTVLVKHNKILFGIFSFVIIISFVWFFTPGVDGSMFFEGNGSPNMVVGKVMGREMKLKEYRKNVERKAIVLSLTYNMAPTAFMDLDNDETFARVVFGEAAKVYGLSASDKEVVEFLRNLPQFRDAKGEFSNAKYEEFVKKNLAESGLGAKDLEEAVREELAMRKLTELLNGVVITADESSKYLDQVMEKVSARAVAFPAADFEKKVKVSEKEMQDYYKANGKTLLTSPRVKGIYVKFAYKDAIAKVKVSDKEAREYYKKNEADFRKDGKTRPYAAVKNEIVKKIKTEKGEKASLDAARSLRDKLYKLSGETENGKDQLDAFRKLCKEAKCKLVDTGYLDEKSIAVAGTGNEPMLVSALFGTNDRYPVSRSVRGNSGAFVGAVTERIPAKQAAYAAVKGEIRRAIVINKSRRLAEEAARNFAAGMTASKNPAKDLASLAVKAGGKIIAIPAFSFRNMDVLRNVKDFNALAAISLIPATGTKALSPLRDLPAGGKVAVFVDSRLLPSAKEKKEAAKEVEELYGRVKKNSALSGLQTWIFANSANYMKKNDGQKAGR